MASDQRFVDFIVGQAALGSALTFRKMFGEYALYVDEKVVALVCDNQLFVKPTTAGRALLGTVAEHAPFPGAKPHFRIDEVIDDGETLQQLLVTTAAALPIPKPKRAAKAKPAARRR